MGNQKTEMTLVGGGIIQWNGENVERWKYKRGECVAPHEE